MCLVAFSWKSNPEYPLIISANRDEFFDRPTSALHQWENGIVAGQDLRSGGTWMGFHPNGRWALVTNYRDFTQKRTPQISRGKLVLDFLEGKEHPRTYLEALEQHKEKYDGYNLLVSDGNQLFYLSNFGEEIIEIEPGIHGLSNGLLNAHWPKIELAKAQLAQLSETELSTENLLEILKSTLKYPPEALPKTGIPTKMEIELSSQLIRMEPNYGTVSASAVLKDKQSLTQIRERSFGWNYSEYNDITFSFLP